MRVRSLAAMTAGIVLVALIAKEYSALKRYVKIRRM